MIHTNQKESRRNRIPAAAELLLLALLLTGAVFGLRAGYRRYMRAAYPTKYSEFVLLYAEKYEVDPSLIYAVIRTESSFDPQAISSAHAMGLMQLTGDTLDWALSKSPEQDEVTRDDLFSPEVNIHYGVYVLHLLREQFEVKGTMLAAYNAGMGNVRKWLKDPAYSKDGESLADIPFEETKAYVDRVLDAQAMYRQLYDLP